MKKLLLIFVVCVALIGCKAQQSCPTYAKIEQVDYEQLEEQKKDTRIGFLFLTAGLVMFATLASN